MVRRVRPARNRRPVTAEFGVAKIQILVDGTVRNLRAWNAIGAGERQDIRIEDPKVSSQHAEVAWFGGRWQVQDISSHGTWLGSARLERREWTPLAENVPVGLANPEPAFVLLDGSPPRPFARNRLHNTEIEGDEDDVLHLPEGDVWYDLEQGWMLSNPQGTHPVSTRVGDWHILVPTPNVRQTVPRLRVLADARVVFKQDGPESVRMELHWPDQDPLVFSRHAELWPVFQLALRRGDGDGWVSTSELAAGSRHAMRTINTYFFRMRGLVIAEQVADGASIVEAGPNRRRFGMPPDRITIEPAD